MAPSRFTPLASAFFALLLLLSMSASSIFAQDTANETISDPDKELDIVRQFEVSPVQIGDGSVIEIAQIDVSEAVTVTVHPDDGNGNPDTAQVLISEEIAAGVVSDLELFIPDDQRKTGTSIYWVVLYHQADEETVIVDTPRRIELQPPTDEEVVRIFDILSPQAGDGFTLTIAAIDVAQPVTLTLHVDVNNTPGMDILASISLDADLSQNLAITVPPAYRPFTNTTYWLQVFVSEEADPVYATTVAYEFMPTEAVRVFEVPPAQLGDGSKVSVDELEITQPMTLALYRDNGEGNGDFNEPIVEQTLDAGIYADLEVTLPEEARPARRANYWVALYIETDSGAEPVGAAQPVELEIAVVQQFDAPSLQSGDGFTLSVVALEVIQPVTITVHAETKGGVIADATSGLSLEPGLHQDFSLEIPREIQPFTDATFRVDVLISGESVPVASTIVEYEFVPTEQVRIFEIAEIQTSTGESIRITELELTVPVTMKLLSDKEGANLNGVIREQPVEPGRYIDLAIRFPPTARPLVDSRYWIALYRDKSLVGQPSQVDLKLTPVIRKLDVETPQLSDGLLISITHVSVTQDVRITLEDIPSREEISEETSSGKIISSLIVRAGSHEDLQIPIPEEHRPISSTTYLLSVIGSDPLALLTQVPVTLTLPAVSLPPQNPTIGIGDFIMLEKVRLGEEVKLTLKRDRNGRPVPTELFTTTLPAGYYESVPLRIPSNRQPTEDRVYWVEFSTSSGVQAHPPITVELWLDFDDVVVRSWRIASPQRGDSRLVAIERLEVLRDVRLTLHPDADGQPDLEKNLGLVTTEPGVHLGLEIPIAAEHLPVTDTRYWIQIQDLDEAMPAEFVPVTLLAPLVQQFNLDHLQLWTARGITISILEIIQDLEIRLSQDKDGIPSTDVITSTKVQAGSYTNLVLEIPENQHPMTDTVYWVQLYDETGTMVTEPLPVQVSLGDPDEGMDAEDLAEIRIQNQTTDGFNVVFDHIALTPPGWVLVYEGMQDQLLKLVGYERVENERNDDFQVFFNQRVQRGAALYAVLHQDIGSLDRMEYPDTDPPIIKNDSAVTASFILGSPTIAAQDQETDGYSIFVDEVIASQDGWLVVYYGDLPTVIGYTRTRMGVARNVAIPIRAALPLGTVTVKIVLHDDNGKPGELELPHPDSVALYEGQIVSTVLSLEVTGSRDLPDEPRSENADSSRGGILPVKSSLTVASDHLMLHNGSITIDSVSIRDDAWLVVYRDNNGTFGEICGYTRLNAGYHQDVQVKLTPPFRIDESIWIALHVDRDVLGELELPEPDSIVMSDGQPVSKRVILKFDPPEFLGEYGASLESP